MSQWLLRCFGYMVSPVVFLPGFVWVGIDERRQGWHHKIAGTLEVRRQRG